MLELAILGVLKEQDLHGYELKKRLTESLGAFSSVSFGSLYPALARLEAAGAVRVLDGDPADPAPPPIPMTGSLGGELAAFRLRAAGRLAGLRSDRADRSDRDRPERADRDRPERAERERPERERPERDRPGAAGGRRGRTRKVYGITERGEQLFEELLATDDSAGDDERAFTLKLAFARHLPPAARLGLLERRRAHLVERLARARRATGSGRARLDTYTRSLLEHGAETTEHDISWLDRLIAAERRQEELA